MYTISTPNTEKIKQQKLSLQMFYEMDTILELYVYMEKFPDQEVHIEHVSAYF